jgi:hypothetical protein
MGVFFLGISLGYFSWLDVRGASYLVAAGVARFNVEMKRRETRHSGMVRTTRPGIST